MSGRRVKTPGEAFKEWFIDTVIGVLVALGTCLCLSVVGLTEDVGLLVGMLVGGVVVTYIEQERK